MPRDNQEFKEFKKYMPNRYSIRNDEPEIHRLPINNDYELFKTHFQQLMNEEFMKSTKLRKIADLKLTLPKQFKYENQIGPFQSLYRNELKEAGAPTTEQQIAEIEKQEIVPAEIETLTGLYSGKEKTSYDVEKYKTLLKKWKNVTEILSEDVLLNYGITRPTPMKAKRNNYNIDFSPLFYKLQGDLRDERNQRILRNIFYYLYPTAQQLQRNQYVKIDENGDLIIQERPRKDIEAEIFATRRTPKKFGALTQDEILLLQQHLRNANRRNLTTNPIRDNDYVYDMVELYNRFITANQHVEGMNMKEAENIVENVKAKTYNNPKPALRAEEELQELQGGGGGGGGGIIVQSPPPVAQAVAPPVAQAQAVAPAPPVATPPRKRVIRKT